MIDFYLYRAFPDALVSKLATDNAELERFEKETLKNFEITGHRASFFRDLEILGKARTKKRIIEALYNEK